MMPNSDKYEKLTEENIIKYLQGKLAFNYLISASISTAISNAGSSP